MYVSIGSSMAVRASSVIGVFDLDNSTCSKHTRAFLRDAEKNGQVVTVADDLPKSFIIAKSKRDSGVRVIASCVSPATIMGRMEKLY